MITSRHFGTTANGERVTEYILTDGDITAHVIDYGCTVTKLIVKDKNGEYRDVVLGYDALSQYEKHTSYLGAVVGRVANRIKDGKFSIDGKQYQLDKNDGENSLHGGNIGFSRRVFKCKTEGNRLIMCYFSPDGEQNYPCNLEVRVDYFLKDNSLCIEYRANSDGKTPVNLTNHSYFNLGGSALEHQLKIDADFITAIDQNLIPTGEMTFVEGTPFDFRKKLKVGRYINMPHKQLEFAGGYDHNFVLKNYGDYRQVASLYSPESGINMDVYTDNFGLQFYSANFLGTEKIKYGKRNRKRNSVCLETQNFPNAVNIKSFPNPFIDSDEEYFKRTTYAFSVK